MRTPLAATLSVPLAALLGLALVACPPADKAEKTDKADAAVKAGAPGTTGPAPCTKFGQTCELSPGKLGTCVVRDGCTEPPAACFVCQSQH